MKIERPVPGVVAFVMSDGRTVLLDAQDEGLAGLYWQPHKSRSAVYAERRIKINGQTVRFRLHRVVLEAKLGRPLLPGMECDHINRNPLDNRRANLREVTRSENERNKVHKRK